jgi:hypothetical protein
MQGSRWRASHLLRACGTGSVSTEKRKMDRIESDPWIKIIKQTVTQIHWLEIISTKGVESEISIYYCTTIVHYVYSIQGAYAFIWRRSTSIPPSSRRRPELVVGCCGGSLFGFSLQVRRSAPIKPCPFLVLSLAPSHHVRALIIIFRNL